MPWHLDSLLAEEYGRVPVRRPKGAGHFLGHCFTLKNSYFKNGIFGQKNFGDTI